MKQEDKELLLKDLCARLPYGVKVQTTYINLKSGERKDISIDVLTTVEISMLIDGIEEHKPYLFPMSSMTEEQSKELEEIDPEFYSVIYENGDVYVSMDARGYDWLNKNHFDYRGLIPMDLAIDATGKNIY